MSFEILIAAASAFVVSKEAAQTLAKFLEAAFLPGTTSAGQAFGKFVELKAQKILAKTAERLHLDGRDIPKLSCKRQECIQRSIFMGAISSGEDLLDYWAGVVAAQTMADSDESADLAGGILSALQNLTDTHAHALLRISDLSVFNDGDELLQPRLGDLCCFSTEDRQDALYPMPNSTQSLIINDLLRLRLVGVSGSGYGGTGDLFLTSSGVELLKYGGWTPRRPNECEKKISDACNQERVRIACCCATKHEKFAAIELTWASPHLQINVLLSDGTYFVYGDRGPTAIHPSVWERFGQFLQNESPVQHNDCGPLSAIRIALRNRKFSSAIKEVTASNDSFVLRVDRLDPTGDYQQWAVTLLCNGTRKSHIDVSVSPWLYKEMEILYESKYRALFNPQC